MEKLFKDPIHNNIRIPTDICRDFVDTELFQRLRFIEQSTMRTLFPSARHDRFIHSLGVYWLAHKMFCHLEGKLRERVKSEDCLSRMRSTFLIAALLHDCAHSPFSHTGEVLAQFCNNDINMGLRSVVNTDAFSRDYKLNGKTHEVASAYVACKKFSAEFEAHFIDREQFSRMIIGCPNSNTGDARLSAYNILISLINGFVLDADRLDYMLRDTWATGISNATVDVDALIAGLDIDGAGRVVIRGKALSGLLNAIYARDYIRRWIVSHHKVVFYNMVLPEAMNALMDAFKSLYDTRSKGADMASEPSLNVADIRKLVFSPDRLLEKKSIGDEVVYLPTDGDILYWMKKYIPDNKYVRAYLSRKNEYQSLWKSLPDFVRLFKVKDSFVSNGGFWLEVHGRFKQYIKDGNLDAFVSEPFAIANDEKADSVCLKVTDHLVFGKSQQNVKADLKLPDIMDSHRQRDRYVIYFYLKKDESEDQTKKDCCKVIKDLKSIFSKAILEFSGNIKTNALPRHFKL